MYGDYSRDRYIDRQQAAGLFEDLLASRRGDGPLLIDGGNLYAMRHASAAVEVPVASTGYRIESVRVPFFTMVFHGLLPLAGPPFNLDGTSEESLLYAAESGLSPLYRLTGRDTYPLADTALNTLCNTAYTHWTADFAQAYRRLRTLIGDLQGETIVHHTYAGELSVCRYSNGAEVAVNFSTQPQTYAGQTVPGRAAVRIH